MCGLQELRGRINPGTTLGATGAREKKSMNELAKMRERVSRQVSVCFALGCVALTASGVVASRSENARQPSKQKSTR